MEANIISVPVEEYKAQIAFYTLGCKLNFAETSTISRTFDSKKYIQVDFDKYADVYVINTCSVTENADNKFKKLVQKSLMINPQAFIAAIGCFAQLQPEKLAEINGVDLVLGASEKFKLNSYLNDLTKKNITAIHSCEIEDVDNYNSSFSFNDRTRSFLKIQDGCDYKCSYCTIPKARGLSNSDTIESIISNANKIAENGVKEIVLTGVNIGDYGKGEFKNKNHKNSFLDLLRKLDELKLIERFRISSIEPNLLKNEIISFVNSSKLFAPHFHIPLQSGSDNILKKMRRRYLSILYLDRINYIKNLMPDACIGADVIVGFPGETDKDFINTFNFISKSSISYLHVFTFSERPNTEAVLLKNRVPINIRNKRSKVLRALSAKKRRFFYESQIGKSGIVLFENENKKGYITGFSENYIKIRTPWDPSLANKSLRVKYNLIDDEGYMRVEELVTI